MDNDLIKALRCIASQGEDGNCKMDWHNLLRKDDEPKMYCSNKVWGDETMQCPYHQDKYETCFEDGDCREWLNEVADILEKYNEKVERLKERFQGYEASKTPPEEVFMIETAHGRRCIDVQDVMRIIDEILEVDKNAK